MKNVEIVAKSAFVEDVIQRPANTTQYTAGDVVSDGTGRQFRFVNAARKAGAGGVIQSCVLIDSTAETTKPDLELYLFNSVITMQADNAAWAPTDYDMGFFVGWIDLSLTAFKTCGANGVIQSVDKGLAFVCQKTTRALFGVLIARNAYTPVSGEILRIKLGILQD